MISHKEINCRTVLQPFLIALSANPNSIVLDTNVSSHKL